MEADGAPNLMDHQRWVNIGIFAAGVIAFLFLRQLFEAGWLLARLPVFENWPIAPSDAIAFGIAGAAILLVKRNGKSNLFLGEVAQELVKVTWPNRKETVVSTGVVLVMVAACTAVLFVIDILWGTITKGVLAG